MTNANVKFETGKHYEHNIFGGLIFKVVNRTAKYVTIEKENGWGAGREYRRMVRTDENGNEYIIDVETGCIFAVEEYSADSPIAEVKDVDNIVIDDYAVSVEAFDIAVEGEIENAKAAEVETKKASRKVITRDDLNSFCFRLEKVSNGQFGALVEAQKKAVALLGTEIPESVYKADNSYHAFHIWLGSEINPVIVYSDGNKDEIRVCGDAYGFVAVKEETPEEKPAEVEGTSDNANEIATEKSYIEQLGTQKIHHAENLVAALESFDERIESGAGIKSLENAARKIGRIIKQIEEINRNIAIHEKRVSDLEKEETSDVANEKKYIGRRIHKYAVHYHLTDEDGYSESGGFFCDDLKVAFAKCTEYGKNILGKDGHAFIKTDVVIYVCYGHGGECVMVEEGANIIRELIKERDAKTVAGYNFDTELDTEIDDAIFAEVEKINAEVKSIAECAAVSEGGDLTIEGKVVSMPDKKGKLRYYSYRFDNGGENQYETSLEVISENRAREIARDWSIEHGYITFDDFMAVSNAEYKKIRSLYIKAGGWLLRQYDIDLANELTTAENPEYVLKEFRDWQKSLKQFITTKNFHFAETAKEEVVKYRKKLLKMKNAA